MTLAAVQQASQDELNRFVRVVDEFKQKYAVLVSQRMRDDVLRTGDMDLIAEYNSTVNKATALNNTIGATVGAWNAFKSKYQSATDKASTAIGDAIDEVRSWFGYDPAPGLGAAQAVAAVPAAVWVAGIVAAAVVLNKAMSSIFVSVEASRIQRETGVDRNTALKQARASLPSLIPEGITLPMLAVGAVALYLLFTRR